MYQGVRNICFSKNLVHFVFFQPYNKIGKYKKLNMTEHKADVYITKIDKYKKSEQQFYDGAQNRHEHY